MGKKGREKQIQQINGTENPETRIHTVFEWHMKYVQLQ